VPGVSGPTGRQGFQGPQSGVQGFQGATGPQGTQGAQGPAGGTPGIATTLVVGSPAPTAGPTGEVRASGAIIAYYSDRRLKDIEGNISNALEKVTKLNGVYYEQNELAGKLGYTKFDERQIGLIAQQVKEVLPEVVRTAVFDSNKYGNSISGENYLTVQYSKIVPLLIEALKEQKEQIDYIKSNL
jgi:hypothetical protein